MNLGTISRCVSTGSLCPNINWRKAQTVQSHLEQHRWTGKRKSQSVRKFETDRRTPTTGGKTAQYGHSKITFRGTAGLPRQRKVGSLLAVVHIIFRERLLQELPPLAPVASSEDLSTSEDLSQGYTNEEYALDLDGPPVFGLLVHPTKSRPRPPKNRRPPKGVTRVLFFTPVPEWYQPFVIKIFTCPGTTGKKLEFLIRFQAEIFASPDWNPFCAPSHVSTSCFALFVWPRWPRFHLNHFVFPRSVFFSVRQISSRNFIYYIKIVSTIILPFDTFYRATLDPFTRPRVQFKSGFEQFLPSSPAVLNNSFHTRLRASFLDN